MATTKLKVKGSQKEKGKGNPIIKGKTSTLLVVRVKAHPKAMVVATLGTTTLLHGSTLITTTQLGIVMIHPRGLHPPMTPLHGLLMPTLRAPKDTKATKEKITVLAEVKIGKEISQATMSGNLFLTLLSKM